MWREITPDQLDQIGDSMAAEHQINDLHYAPELADLDCRLVLAMLLRRAGGEVEFTEREVNDAMLGKSMHIIGLREPRVGLVAKLVDNEDRSAG